MYLYLPILVSYLFLLSSFLAYVRTGFYYLFLRPFYFLESFTLYVLSSLTPLSTSLFTCIYLSTPAIHCPLHTALLSCYYLVLHTMPIYSCLQSFTFYVLSIPSYCLTYMLSSIVPRSSCCPTYVLTVIPLSAIALSYLQSFTTYVLSLFYMLFLLYPGLSLVCIPYLLSCYYVLSHDSLLHVLPTILYLYLLSYFLSLSSLTFYMSYLLYPGLSTVLHTYVLSCLYLFLQSFTAYYRSYLAYVRTCYFLYNTAYPLSYVPYLLSYRYLLLHTLTILIVFLLTI
jgi:hypothetical protein